MRILVVDDQASVLRLVQRTLEREGHLVDAVSHATEAMARLREGVYDLALVDLSLPDLPGDALIRQINQARPELPVVLMTGLQLERPLPGTALALFKPFSIEMLRDTIAIFERLPKNEHRPEPKKGS